MWLTRVYNPTSEHMDMPGEIKPRGGPGGNRARDFGPFLTLGLQLALSVVVFFFVGRWLDQWLGTTPWLMIAGLTLGSVGGFIHFFRTVIALGKEEDRKAEENRKRTEGESS